MERTEGMPPAAEAPRALAWVSSLDRQAGVATLGSPGGSWTLGRADAPGAWAWLFMGALVSFEPEGSAATTVRLMV